MTATALFIELVIVGVGAASWLILFLSTLFSCKFQEVLVQNNPIMVIIFMATVYVLGIVADRLIRDIFMPTIETYARQKVFTVAVVDMIIEIRSHIKEENMAMELEKFIRASSDSLAKKIDYNRSRLRICRAWTLHFLLIGIAFAFWNIRFGEADNQATVLTISIGIIFSLLTLRTTCLLAIDHQRDLLESFQIVILESSK